MSLGISKLRLPQKAALKLLLTPIGKKPTPTKRRNKMKTEEPFTLITSLPPNHLFSHPLPGVMSQARQMQCKYSQETH